MLLVFFVDFVALAQHLLSSVVEPLTALRKKEKGYKASALKILRRLGRN
jgi:hypothetical protein